MARSKPSKQLSQSEIDRFLVAAEALHWSIVKPFISPNCEHYRATRVLHEVLLKAVREVTGKEVEFIPWNTTGPVRPLRLGSNAIAPAQAAASKRQTLRRCRRAASGIARWRARPYDGGLGFAIAHIFASLRHRYRKGPGGSVTGDFRRSVDG